MNLPADNDLEILKFIALFGVSFTEVIGRTFYKSEQSARNKISKLVSLGILKRKATGLSKPKYGIILSLGVKRELVDRGFPVVERKMSVRVLNHLMMEQITYFHLGKIGDIHKKSVWLHKNSYFSVPDFVLHWKNNKIFIEVEVNQKSRKAYLGVVLNMKKDNPSSVLYIVPNAKFMKTIATSMPLWDKLYFIDIDALIFNIEHDEKVKPIKQAYFFEKVSKSA